MWRWFRDRWKRRKARALRDRLVKNRDKGKERRKAERNKDERTTATAVYECRVTLFLDFLGFKEVVERSLNDSSVICEVLRAVRQAGFLIDDDGASESEMVTQFSDSMVVSVRADEKSGVFWTLDGIGMIVVDLAGRGFLVRGGLTVGPLYHTDELVMGPAMNRAYKLENKIAKAPRVIVDRMVLRTAKNAAAPQHSPDQEVEYSRSLLKNDADHRLYVDYITCNAFENLGCRREHYPSYFRNLTELAAAGLAHPDGRVREKYAWLDNRLKIEIDNLTKIGAIPGRRAMDHEFYDEIDRVAADYKAALASMTTLNTTP